MEVRRARGSPHWEAPWQGLGDMCSSWDDNFLFLFYYEMKEVIRLRLKLYTMLREGDNLRAVRWRVRQRVWRS